jgi:hypothetical protein
VVDRLPPERGAVLLTFSPHDRSACRSGSGGCSAAGGCSVAADGRTFLFDAPFLGAD